MMITTLLFAMAGIGGAAQSAPNFTPEQQTYILNEMERQKRVKSLTNEQALIVYDQCLAREGAALSRTNYADDAIFPLARARCSAIRAELLNGSTTERFAQFKKFDENKATAFPGLTKQIRERRHQFEAETGKNNSAPNQ
jgi:hypothetical protein